MKNKFKKINGKEIDLEEYSKNYMRENPQCQIMVGCDSQNRKGLTYYALVVGFYNPGHGAHIIFKRWKTPREKIRSVRLINEVWASLEVAEELKGYGLPKATWIDIDINPNPKYKSSEVFNQAVGMVEGMGYEVRYKTVAPLITTMADTIVRS